MEIKKVIVDKIPESCGKCQLMQYICDSPKCVAIADENKWDIAGNPYDMTYRRSDCPLKEDITIGDIIDGN